MIGLAEKETTVLAAKDKNHAAVRCRNCTENIDRESVKVGWGGFPFCCDACVGTFENSILKA